MIGYVSGRVMRTVAATCVSLGLAGSGCTVFGAATGAAAGYRSFELAPNRDPNHSPGTDIMIGAVIGGAVGLFFDYIIFSNLFDALRDRSPSKPANVSNHPRPLSPQLGSAARPD